MKKILTLFLAVSVLLLCACSEEKNNFDVEDVKTENMNNNDIEPNSMDNILPVPFDTTPTIQETVIYDNNNIKITANSLTYTDTLANISVTLENNTDKDLSFICNSASHQVNSINGYMINEGGLMCDVLAGQSSVETIFFEFTDLNVFGITKISDIEIGFLISDKNYSFYEQTGALPIKTSIFESYDYEENSYQQTINDGTFEKNFNSKLLHFSSENIFKNYSISIDSVTVMSNDDSKPLLLLELKNLSDKLQDIAIKKVYINNVSVYDSLWTSATISPDKKYILDIDLPHLASEYDGDVSDVNEISEISFEISIKENQNGINNVDIVTIKLPNINVPTE